MTKQMSPWTLQIDEFTWEVLQKPLCPPFAKNRNKWIRGTTKIDQKSIKYRSGDGTKKKNNPKLVFRISHRKCIKTGPEGGESPIRAHLGPQGLPMEPPGDSEDQFVKISARFGHSCLQFC